ncbi:phosphoglycerate mutase-like protein [Penicillium capsulatum]|uniref:Phosphoglycerate mutase-like protein n=1 Tax=Penicillium capsulatum TaxID=69766 RepID=A0A9W9LVT0_9EURO|nr:phosphoglycerate mutase-like protein [Penicillium capsulatum]
MPGNMKVTTGWGNTEFRTYEFISSEQGKGDNPMQETAESRRRRGISSPPPPQMQQRELAGQMIQIWAEQGYAIGSFRETRVPGEVPAK